MKPPSGPCAGVMGKPIQHSLSPLIHNAWLEAAGIPAIYVPVEVERGRLFALVDPLRYGGHMRGYNVTIPLKEEALAAADVVSDRARAAGAANLIVFKPCEGPREALIHADNTDGIGLLEALRVQAPGLDVAAAPVVVLGAGGAARGAVAALVGAGARVRIVNRTRERAEAIAGLFPGKVEVSDTADAAALSGAGLVVNATSLGLGGGEGPALDWDALPANAVVMDMVYKPLRTAFLAEAARRGHATVDGLEMLIRQAIPSFEALFGRPPPTDRVDVRALCLAALGEA